MNKVLLTGASHGLGRSALDVLVEKNVAVTAVARNVRDLQQVQGIQSTRAALQTDKHFAQIDLQPTDLSQISPTEALNLLQGHDTVWHCAAKSSPWGKYDDFYAANVHATEQLAQAAGQAGVQTFVHISTPSLYFDFQHTTTTSPKPLCLQHLLTITPKPNGWRSKKCYRPHQTIQIRNTSCCDRGRYLANTTAC